MASKLFLSAAACCVGVAAVCGYALEGQTWPQNSNVTMQLSLGSNQTLIDGFTSFNQSAEDALGLWNQKLSRFQYSVVRNSTVAPRDGDRQNSVFFSNTVFGKAYGNDTLAVTLRTYQGTTIVEADVMFNSAKPFNSYRGPLRGASGGGALHDLHRVAIHEFGHVFGLDHPDEAGQNVVAIMNSIESDIDSLQSDDIAGGQSLYGAPNAAPTPIPTPTATPGPANNLVNLSTRGVIGTGENVLIGGFIVQGTQQDSVLLRAIGPSLTAAGVSGAIADPMLELHDQSGTLLQSDDDWEDDPTSAAAVRATGLAPTDGRESALIAKLSGGNYTAIVRGFNGTTGVGLVELYDLHTSTSRVGNISTRDTVQAGDKIMISGFIVNGSKAKQVILRALGPSLLGSSGITGRLADPVLRLRDGNGNDVAVNDDWRSGPDATTIENLGLAPTDDREAAVLATINPGNYTAAVSGKNGATGIALAEVYDLSEAPAQ